MFYKKNLKAFGFSIVLVFVYFVIVGRSIFLQVEIPRYLKKYGAKFVCLQYIEKCARQLFRNPRLPRNNSFKKILLYSEHIFP